MPSTSDGIPHTSPGPHLSPLYKTQTKQTKNDYYFPNSLSNQHLSSPPPSLYRCNPNPNPLPHHHTPTSTQSHPTHSPPPPMEKSRSYDCFDSSSAFSDCNSDRSGEFSTTSSQNLRCFIASSSDNPDELINQLVADLLSTSLDVQRQSALELRLLAKNKQENRLKIARAGAVRPLVSLICSPDYQLQEYGVTAILNLSLCDENKELIMKSGATNPLVRALQTGTTTAKENSACALLRLSQIEENKIAIGRSGAIPLLVELLQNGSTRGKKDAATALYSLCSMRENKIRAIKSGIMRPILELMSDFESGMVDKSAFVLSVLVTVQEGKVALVKEDGVPVLVEIVEVGSNRQKEIVSAILLQICDGNPVYCDMVAREGAIPALVDLVNVGTSRAKQKAKALLELLRQSSGNHNTQ